MPFDHNSQWEATRLYDRRRRKVTRNIVELTSADLEFVAAHRTHTNRLGVAVQLGFLRYPGRAWTLEEAAPAAMLRFIKLTGVLTEVDSWCDFGRHFTNAG